MSFLTKLFQRRVEDFTCEKCGAGVRGNGYTNHCPWCLYSKHVDVNPGDRRAMCGGLMKPTGVDRKGGVYVVVQTCERCGHTRRNAVAKNDNFEALIHISTGADS